MDSGANIRTIFELGDQTNLKRWVTENGWLRSSDSAAYFTDGQIYNKKLLARSCEKNWADFFWGGWFPKMFPYTFKKSFQWPLTLRIRVSIYLSICLSVCLSVYLYLCVYLSIYRSIDRSIYLSIHLSIYRSSGGQEADKSPLCSPLTRLILW